MKRWTISVLVLGLASAAIPAVGAVETGDDMGWLAYDLSADAAVEPGASVEDPASAEFDTDALLIEAETETLVVVEASGIAPLDEAALTAVEIVDALETPVQSEAQAVAPAPDASETILAVWENPVEAEGAATASSEDGVTVALTISAAGQSVGSDDVTGTVGAAGSGARGLLVRPSGPVPSGPPEDDEVGYPLASDHGVGSSAAIVVPIALDPAVLAAFAAVMILGGSAVGLALFPGWRAFLWRLLKASPLAFLFSRIERGEALDHARRQEIFDYIRENPGERVEVARRAVGLPNGSMFHHLRVLIEKDLVRALKDGAMTRLYPAGPRIQPTPYLGARWREILATVASHPGLGQREIARSLGTSERMISYHVTRLSEKGILHVERRGTRKLCFVNGGVPTLPSLSSVPMSP